MRMKKTPDGIEAIRRFSFKTCLAEEGGGRKKAWLVGTEPVASKKRPSEMNLLESPHDETCARREVDASLGKDQLVEFGGSKEVERAVVPDLERLAAT